jgi:hypothetical protein
MEIGRRCGGRPLWSRTYIGVFVIGMTLGAAVTSEAAVLDLSWTAPTTNADGSRLTDLAGYRVYIATSTPACPGSSFHAVPSSTSSPSSGQTVSRTITGLNAGTTYWVRVTAVDSSGNQSACTTAASGVARASLSVSPTGAVNFGSIATGSTVDRTFTVQNTTGATVSGGASVGAPFSIVSGASFSLAAGASQSVVVRFRPTAAGSFAANVSFTAGGDTVSRSVSGSATGSASSPSTTPPMLTVTRAGTGSGTVTSSPSGINCGSTCAWTYTAGTQVTLTASPASGSRFAGWSGGGCSGTGTCAVTLNSATTVTATFSPASSGSLPDLVVTGLVIPSTVAIDTAFSMHFNLVNQGTATAGSSVLRIYLSRDDRLSSDDVLLRQRSFGSVAAGATVANAITESIPAGTSAGSYYVLLVADAGGAVAESNESNNVLARAVTVGGTSTSAPSSTTSPRLTVTRAGTGAGTVTSSPSGINCGSTCAWTYTAGTRVTLTASAASGSRFAGWSGGGCSGTGTCAVTLNGASTVTATFTSTASASGSLPDLVVTGLVIPSTVSINTGFVMTFNLVNQGTATAGSSVLRIYLSRDTRLSSDDVLLRQRSFGSVAAGATVANAITESIAAGTRAGSYYVLLVADAGGAVAESNESNNTLARAITVR